VILPAISGGFRADAPSDESSQPSGIRPQSDVSKPKIHRRQMVIDNLPGTYAMMPDVLGKRLGES
jgi:hypothetical protein